MNLYVKEYFDEFIFGYMFTDIENCIYAKANYTVALALLSYTEYLGGFVNGTLGLRDKSQEQFNKALEYFDWNGDFEYYKNFRQPYIDIDSKNKVGNIYSLFRCGLAHEYFIKGDALVLNNPGIYTDNNGIMHTEGGL